MAFDAKRRYPKPRLDKLGVKAESRICLVGAFDEDFLAEVRGRAASVATRAVKQADLVFFTASKTSDLSKLKKLRASIAPNGAIWVLWPKGRPELKEDHVREHAKTIGLVDVKVMAFSDRLSALKLVIPVRQRSAAFAP